MPAKMIKYSSNARQTVLDGVNILADAVKLTLGPNDNDVILDKFFGFHTVTKDGVTAAKEIKLEDEFQNMGTL